MGNYTPHIAKETYLADHMAHESTFIHVIWIIVISWIWIATPEKSRKVLGTHRYLARFELLTDPRCVYKYVYQDSM